MSTTTPAAGDAAPASIDAPIAFSKQRLAREFGIARETVARLLDAARIEPSGERGGYPVFKLADVAGVLSDYARFGRHPGETADPAHMSPKERLDWFNSKRAELAYLRDAGELLEVAGVREEYAGALQVLKSWMLTVPDRLERDADLNADQVARVVVSGDALLNQLHDALVVRAGGEPAQ